MSNPTVELPQLDSIRAALHSLVVDNPELERLETSLDQFNVFEALGAVRQELRHSWFLAFLLDPEGNHGLGDEFARRLLQKVLINAPDNLIPVTPIDLDIWDLNELTVHREWQNIDILITEKNHRLAVIIENKIDSTEHSNQLERYSQVVRQHYPNWNVFGIYLTPEGEASSHAGYVATSYTTISEIVERIVESRSSTLGIDVRTLMVHYTQMLRRHIVTDSDTAELCRRIYRKHQRALDLIYEHRPDQQAAIRETLENLVRATGALILDHSSKSYIRFAPQEWDVPMLMLGKGWTESGRILLFEFNNSSDRLKLGLHIGPGPDDIRRRLFDMAQANQPFFKPSRSLNQKWNVIYGKSFLSPKNYDESNIEERSEEIRKHWIEFTEGDLPKIVDVVRKAERIFEGPSSAESASLAIDAPN